MSKTLATWANGISAAFERNMGTAIGAFSEYLENASYAEPDAKGRMPWDLDFHYLTNNILGTIWQQIYGNTTDTSGNPDPRANLANDYFKAVHVLARADKMLADYVLSRPECDETDSRRFNPEVAAEDQRFLALTTAEEAAQKRYDALLAMFNAYLDLYHDLYEEAWAYKPYAVKAEALPRSQTAQQQQVAERFRAMKNKTAAA